jgi:hypothetical protein
MNTRKCGHLAPCGCEDVALVTPAPCPDPGPCPTPYPCSETIDAQCVLYSGDDIICDQTAVVSQGMSAAEAMVAIVDYFCNATGSISQNITCGDDTVVIAGSTFADAFEQVVDYFCTNSGLIIVQGDNQSINVSLVGNTYTVSQLDTGWVDLTGFAYYQGAMSSNKPQVRRIGKQIHFRGDLYIPLSNGTAVIPLTTQDTYRSVYRKSPATGTGNVYFDANDQLYFNSTGSAGGVVIPTSVLPALTNLDGNYKLTRELASRQMEVFTTNDPDLREPGTLLLHAPIEVTILSNKQLRITSLEVLERNSADVASFNGSSSLRQITSSFTSRASLLDFSSYLYFGNGLNSTATAPFIVEAPAPPSPSFVIGQLYYIRNYQPGDDFTNIGAAVNTGGQSFIATGQTPTNWTNGSLIYRLPESIQSNSYFYPYLSPSTGYASQTPILLDGMSLNGATAFDLGGYKISLDGLIAYIA